MRASLAWIPKLWSNPWSLVGTVLTTVSGIALLFLFGLPVTGVTLHPFVGSFLLVGLPLMFVVGLLLIPFGLWRAHKRGKDAPQRSLGEAIGALFSTPAGRKRLLVIGLLTFANVVLVAAAAQRVVAWTSDPTFCGTTCHGVMAPEWETYHDKPHAQVACVQCHVGSGPASYMRSKIDGLRQVWSTMRDSYERPVPAPVHSLPPASETCLKCHWPETWHGNRPTLYSHTVPDEGNSELVNVLTLKVGGRHPETGTWTGYHWHASPDLEIRYEVLDEKRTEIGKVTVLRKGKVVEVFSPPAASKPVVATRSMDCIDCHNRPTHRFDASPTHALDRAFAHGLLDRKVKWLRELAEPLLADTKHTREGVKDDFRKALEAAYREKHADAVPDAATLEKAAQGLAALWRENVFPDRAVVWGTYPSHIGHQSGDAAHHGCFRCHDGQHKSASGKVLSDECDVCHETLAQDEKRGDLDAELKALLGIR
jgi:nitrate/TMAO reductase-like tetraheme cytochrome c subunit